MATALAVTAAGTASVLGVLFSFEWADVVHGTPGWLPYIGFVQVALAGAAGALVARAAT